MTIQHARDAAMEAAHFLEALPILDGLEVMVGDKPSDDGAVLEIAWKGGSFQAVFNTDMTVSSDVEVFGPWAEQFDPWRAWALTVAQFLAIGTDPATRIPFGTHPPAQNHPGMARKIEFFGPITRWTVLLVDPAGPLVIGAPIFWVGSACAAMSEDDPRESMYEGHAMRWLLRTRVYDRATQSWGWNMTADAADVDDTWNACDAIVGAAVESLPEDLVGAPHRGRINVDHIREIVVATIGTPAVEARARPTIADDLKFIEVKGADRHPVIKRLIAGPVQYANRDVRVVVEARYDDTYGIDGFTVMSISQARSRASGGYMAFRDGRDWHAVVWDDGFVEAPATVEGVADVNAHWVTWAKIGIDYISNKSTRISVVISAERLCNMGHWHEDDEALERGWYGPELIDPYGTDDLDDMVAAAIEGCLPSDLIEILRK